VDASQCWLTLCLSLADLAPYDHHAVMLSPPFSHCPMASTVLSRRRALVLLLAASQLQDYDIVGWVCLAG